MSKWILAACITFTYLSALPAQAEHAWESRAPIPEPVEGACDGVIGNKIYLAFGYSNGDSNRLRIYDIDTDTWTFGPPAPTAGRSEPYEGVTHGGRLYCSGGRSTTEVWSFHPASSTWTPLAPTPDLRIGASQEGKGGSIYLFGGRDGSSPCSSRAKSTVLRYDIDLNQWFPAGTMVVPRSDASATRFGRYVYIFGGCDGNATHNSVERYDTVTQTSVLLPVAMPTPRANVASAEAGPHTIRVTGGHINNAPAAPNHLIFDVDTESILIGTPMPTAPCPTPNRSEHDLVYHGGRIYALGGACPAFGTSINSVDMLKLSP